MKVSNKTKDILLIIFCLAIIAGAILCVGIKASKLFAETKTISSDEERLERVVAFCNKKSFWEEQ